MANVEQCFTQLVLRLASLSDANGSSSRLRDLLTRLVCCLASEYWLESQCFENFFTEQLGALQAQNPVVLRLLLTEIVSAVKTLVAACENGSVPDEDSDLSSQADPSSRQSDSLNHRAFKTVSLFKASGNLSIFELVH